MRFELSGSITQLDPLVFEFEGNQDFDFSTYITSGYTYYEVICIGAGGGRGGGIDTQDTGTSIRNYGGEGGGGGFHRVRGLLSALPTPCAIVVGTAGAAGTEHNVLPGSTTDGGDGGYSSFNSTTCRASGGKGGKHVQTNSDNVTTQAHGGQGGVGDSITAGGGAAGGLAGTPTQNGPGTPGTDGTDGTLLPSIGQGGGGGAGGVGKYDSGGSPITCVPGTSGGRGSFDPGDTLVYGPGGNPSDDPDSGADNTVPGTAGGAKATPLNGLPISYGSSGDSGVVIVRLTAE